MTNTQTNNTEKNKFWAFSILSDAQKELARGNSVRANELINDAKRVLNGKYVELNGGLSIEIQRGRIK
jgi:hypothetical protein